MIFQWESQSATAYLKQLMSDETIAKIKEQLAKKKYDEYQYSDAKWHLTEDEYFKFQDEMEKAEYEYEEAKCEVKTLLSELKYNIYEEDLKEC